MKVYHLLIAAVIAVCCIAAAGCVQTTDENGKVPLDYANPENWMFQDKVPTAEVDLFYIYPTVATYATDGGFIGEVTPEMKEGAKEAFMVQGSAFADYCNVFAPYYRQIAFYNASQILDHYVYMDMLRENEPKADIYAAIDYYFKNLNNGRPFIIAGHSQGSAMVQLVLEGYLEEHPEYYKNMVAAYPIGWGVSQDWLDDNPHLKFATGETDTGVVISWNTEIPGATMPSIVLGNETIAINPLTWTTAETYADKSLNKGSIVTTESATEIGPGIVVYDSASTLQSGLNDAQVDKERGVVICTTCPENALSADFFNGILGDGSLHLEDYGAYYTNIRENGLARIEAFLGYKPFVGEPMNYAKSDNWIYVEKNPTHDVDLFYVYPTIEFESDKFIYEIDPSVATDDSETLTIGTSSVSFKDTAVVTPETIEEAKSAFAQSGAAFAEYTNVYAPTYRQIPLDRAFQTSTHDEYIELLRDSRARTDVFAALDYYFEHYNKGAERPFILAGHSQGSAMTQVILDDYMKQHPEYYKNMVAAYVVGYGTAQPWLDENPHLKFATGETDTGVVISWNTEGPGATKESVLIGENPKVINPLTWTTEETYADKSLNKGALVIADDGSSSLVPGLHDAQVDNTRHALICTTGTNYLPTFSETSLHAEDYNYYFANIRENGQKRIDAFLAKTA